ncbi:MAG TPA: acyltransferase family protein [Hyphomicrobiaceae bacterium]|nr:acyltransferase family protein [Hyphomicrobiaceae bacterium]
MHACQAAAIDDARVVRHRHDVDGLRAVAVLAILAFHLNLAGFEGGFVGVDIFFVISGYVILRSILPDLEHGRFSLADFFIRRMRRLLPALMVVLLLTMAAGLLILSPAELQELSGSALSTLGFCANLFFNDRTGYFASAAHTRPLLHMWSLGVEEQFYILVPLALALLIRYRGTAPGKVLLALTLVSLAYGLAAPYAVNETHAFYMPMARFWEIGVGGLVAVAERRWGPMCASPRAAVDGLALLGLTAVGLSVVILSSEASGGQQWAVIPVVGTAAIIAAGSAEGSRVAAMLASTPLVAIGRLSYSIYLVHWSLIVLWRLGTARPLAPYEQVIVVLLTMALAMVLSAFVEAPMRSGSTRIGNRRALIGIGTAGAVVASIAAGLLVNGGAEWRLQGPARESLLALRTAMLQRPRCQEDRQFLGSSLRACRWQAEAPGVDYVIWGDSHARALAPELAPELARVLGGVKPSSGVLIGVPHCWPVAGVKVVAHKSSARCPEVAEAVIEAIARERPKIVVMVGRWATIASDVRSPSSGVRPGRLVDLRNDEAPITLADALIRTVEQVRASGAFVLVVGPVPEIAFEVPPTVGRALQGWGKLPEVRRTDFDKRQRQVLSALSKLQPRPGVLVVYPHTTFCDASSCIVTDGVRPLYEDNNHLSPFGAARVSAQIAAELRHVQFASKPIGAEPTPYVR